MLQKTENGKTLKEMIVDGEVVGTYGMVAGSSTQQANFDLAFTPVTNSYPNAATGQYPVQSGDTLESIALSAYGDSSLWYLIADANGLSGDGDLRVGQVINIPTKVNGVHNNASTITPYDPSKIVGSTTPNLPAPQSKHGCGALGLIIMAVVAVVATVFTAGVAAVGYSAAFADLGATFAAGAAVLTGSAGAAFTGLAAIGVAAGAAAAGSVASQLVGMAIGQTQGFSWKQVGLSAIGGALTAGAGGFASGAAGSAAAGTVTGGTSTAVNVGTSLGQAAANFGGAVLNGAVTSAETQGLGVVLGLQKNFSWRNVAAAGVGAGVGEEVGAAVQNSSVFNTGAFGVVVGKEVTNLAATAVSAEIEDKGKAKLENIFGQATGDTAAVYAVAGIQSYEQQQSHDLSSSNYENEMDRASDAADAAKQAAANVANGLTPAGAVDYARMASNAGSYVASLFDANSSAQALVIAPLPDQIDAGVVHDAVMATLPGPVSAAADVASALRVEQVGNAVGDMPNYGLTAKGGAAMDPGFSMNPGPDMDPAFSMNPGPDMDPGFSTPNDGVGINADGTLNFNDTAQEQLQSAQHQAADAASMNAAEMSRFAAAAVQSNAVPQIVQGAFGNALGSSVAAASASSLPTTSNPNTDPAQFAQLDFVPPEAGAGTGSGPGSGLTFAQSHANLTALVGAPTGGNNGSGWVSNSGDPVYDAQIARMNSQLDQDIANQPSNPNAVRVEIDGPTTDEYNAYRIQDAEARGDSNLQPTMANAARLQLRMPQPGVDGGTISLADALEYGSANNYNGESTPVGAPSSMSYVDQMASVSSALHFDQGFVKNSYDQAAAGAFNDSNDWVNRGVNYVAAAAMLPLALFEEGTRGLINIPSEAFGAIPQADQAGTQVGVALDSSQSNDARIMAALSATSLFSGSSVALAGAATAFSPAYEVGNLGNSALDGLAGDDAIAVRGIGSPARADRTHILTPDEIAQVTNEWQSLGGDPDVLQFNRQGQNTGYAEQIGKVFINGDVFPTTSESLHPTATLSVRETLAHEMGHMAYPGTDVSYGAWNDEFRASYWASKNVPGLTLDEQRNLVIDAWQRAQDAGQSVQMNSYIRQMIYGF